METRDRLLRTGAVAIVLAVAVRLVLPWVQELSFWQWFVLLQTGRLARPPVTQTEPPTEPVLSQQTGASVQLSNHTHYRVDIPALLQPVEEERPPVLILHTHGTESYRKTEDYRESTPYRTRDTDYNVVSVGQHLARLLEERGFAAQQDSTLYDLQDYAGAYEAARAGTLQRLQAGQTPLILDLHRDAVTDDRGRPLPTAVDSPLGSCAQLMLVVGTDAGGLSHPDWQENLALAVKLQVQLEQLCPGLCRPIQLRSARYNQDLSPAALLIEVGSTGNTRQQALLAVEYLAQALEALYQ